jgi:hypothetical protein
MTELPKLNDHVRAVVEGRVSWVGDRTFRVGDGMDSSVICKASDHLISVETVRPPVVYLSKAKDEDRSPFAVLWGDKTVVVYTYDEERGWIYRNSDSSEWGRSGWQSRKEIMSLYEKEVPLPEWFTKEGEDHSPFAVRLGSGIDSNVVYSYNEEVGGWQYRTDPVHPWANSSFTSRDEILGKYDNKEVPLPEWFTAQVEGEKV